MKKLLLLLLLCPIMAMAKFYPGTITFNDGSAKTGWVATPRYDKQKIEFRTEEKGESEEFSIDEVKKFTITVDKEELTYYALKLADPKAFKKEIKAPSKKKSWVRMITPGNGINIVMTYYYSAAVMGATASMATNSYIYYFWKPQNDYCTFLYADMTTGVSLFKIGNYNSIKRGVEMNFSKDCPEMIEKMDKEDIKKNGIQRLVTLYDENCGSTK